MTQNIDLYPLLAFARSELGAEERFLALSAGIEIPDTDKKEISEIIQSGEIDWDVFIHMVLAYRIAPFAYRHLRGMKDTVPDSVLNMLREEAALAFARNTIAAGEIRTVSRIFEEAGVEIIFLKGAALMYDVYGGPGLREFNDIDVLIRERDLERADEALVSGGFTRVSEGGEAADYRSQRVYTFKDKFTLDLHTGVVGRKLHDKMLGMDQEELFRRKRPLDAGGTTINTLDVTHTLLYQSIHLGIQHGFIGLIWGVDIREILKKHAAAIDWGEVKERSARYGIRKPVYYSLRLASNMLNAPVPPDALESFGSARGKLDGWALRRIKRGNREVDYIAELFMFDSFFETARFAVLSLIRYPNLVGHFSKVLGRMASGLVSRGKR